MKKAAVGRRAAKSAEKPKTVRPLNGYNMYIRDKMVNKTNGSQAAHRDAMRGVAEAWKNLSDKEKAKYKNKANRANTRTGRTGKSKRRASD